MPEPDDKQRELDRLITQMREGSNEDAIKAVDELREHGWLTDGSLRDCDLRGADLRRADLKDADLQRTNLWGVSIARADLTKANLADTNLRGANLLEANLAEADLLNADLLGTFLGDANLTETNLGKTNLKDAFLGNANLSRVNLSSANLCNTDLENADLTNARCIWTIFSDVDLSTVRGLESIRHRGPSYIDIRTIYRSKGKIPEIFLRGCGVPKEFIEFTKGLFGEKAIQFHLCFISYSHKDEVFPQKLHEALYDRGVNNWIDTKDLRGGDFWADVINQAINHYEKLVVCCSEYSLHSLGVDREVNTVLRIEERIYQQTKEKVSLIIPVDMDGYIHQCDNHVARRLQERHIINAQNWQNDFEAVLSDVLKALRTDEGRETPPEPKL